MAGEERGQQGQGRGREGSNLAMRGQRSGVGFDFFSAGRGQGGRVGLISGADRTEGRSGVGLNYGRGNWMGEVGYQWIPWLDKSIMPVR
jgi:hypothetical protein